MHVSYMYVCSCMYVTHIHTNLHNSTEILRTWENRADDTWHGLQLWSDLPFPACPIHDDEFFLREVLCVLLWVQWQELVLWQGFPTPTLVASWEAQPSCSQNPTLSSQMSVTPSCEHLHKFSIRAGTDSAGHWSMSQGRESKAFWCQVQCTDRRSFPEFFFKYWRYL